MQVHQGYDKTKWTALFFLPAILGGVIVLMSILIAVFEISYNSMKEEFPQQAVAANRISLAVIFTLWTWLDPEERDDCSPIPFKKLSKSSFIAFMNKVHNIPEAGEVGQRRRAVAEFVFELIDKDKSDSVDFGEFEQVAFIWNCVELLKNNELLAHQTQLARSEKLLEESINALEHLHLDIHDASTLRQQITEQQHVVEADALQLEQHYSGIVDALAPSRYLSLLAHDRIIIIAIIVHGMILAQQSNDDVSEYVLYISAFFSVCHALEISLRIWAAGNFASFWIDGRGAQFSMQNRFSLLATALAVAGCLLFCGQKLTSEDDEIRPAMFLMEIQLWRILIVEQQFQRMTNSFIVGMRKISKFGVILFAVFYSYSIIGYELFSGVDYSKLGTEGNFNTRLDSFLTMFQIFIGANWSDFMQVTSQQTNKATEWFFVSFVFLVSVVFTQLFVGILISTFGALEESYASMQSKVLVAFADAAKNLSEHEQANVLEELGVLARRLLQVSTGSSDWLNPEMCDQPDNFDIFECPTLELTQFESGSDKQWNPVWNSIVDDLLEIGFEDTETVQIAVADSQGNFKSAIKLLVADLKSL